jgi:hypothetical protein
VSAIGEVGWIVFACVFGSALIGMALRKVLPEHHLASDSKDVVKLGIALIATMAALVLSLLLSSAKSSFDQRNAEFAQMAANIVLLDRLLAHYGPEAKPARESLRGSVETALAQIWPDQNFHPSQLAPASTAPEAIYETIQSLCRRTICGDRCSRKRWRRRPAWRSSAGYCSRKRPKARFQRRSWWCWCFGCASSSRASASTLRVT